MIKKKQQAMDADYHAILHIYSFAPIIKQTGDCLALVYLVLVVTGVEDLKCLVENCCFFPLMKLLLISLSDVFSSYIFLSRIKSNHIRFFRIISLQNTNTITFY